MLTIKNLGQVELKIVLFFTFFVVHIFFSAEIFFKVDHLFVETADVMLCDGCFIERLLKASSSSSFRGWTELLLLDSVTRY